MTISVDEFLVDIPLLHSWDKGKTWNTGGFEARHFEPLRELIESRSLRRIIETGCGASTIFFLLLDPEDLVSIDPKDEVYRRISAYCETKAISMANHEMYTHRSELALPEIARERACQFDFVLIDGDHAWPTVFVDFCYCNILLRKGGMLMIDDVHLHSVRELARFLSEEPGFALRLDLGKALVFEKLSDRAHPKGWKAQPYILRSSEPRTIVQRLKAALKLV